MKDKIHSFFESYPTRDEVSETSDGQLFFDKWDAQNHARSLKDTGLVRHFRNKELNAVEENMQEHTVTNEDRNNNAELQKQGIRAGDAAEQEKEKPKKSGKKKA